MEIGERWHVTAPVLATVTRQVASNSEDGSAEEAIQFKQNAKHNATGKITKERLAGDRSLWLVYDESNSNQILIAMSIMTSVSSDDDFVSNARVSATQREPCNGTWTITRSSVLLSYGSCGRNATAGTLEPSYQDAFTKNNLDLHTWYLPTLKEYIGTFSNDNDTWLAPTMATTIAGMMYSRVTALGGSQQSNATFGGYNYTSREEPTISSTKPGISRSKAVLFVLCLQPALLLATMVLISMLYAVPIDKNFGLVSILAGVDCASLKCLTGASLSAKLRSRVRLSIAVHDAGEGHSAIQYTVNDEATGVRHRAQRGNVYS